MSTFQDLIGIAIDRGASDLHLSAGMPPCIRVNGSIIRLEDTMYMPDTIQEIVNEIIDEKHLSRLKEVGEVDFAYSIPALGRFRVNVFRQRGSLSMAVRILKYAALHVRAEVSVYSNLFLSVHRMIVYQTELLQTRRF